MNDWLWEDFQRWFSELISSFRLMAENEHPRAEDTATFRATAEEVVAKYVALKKCENVKEDLVGRCEKENFNIESMDINCKKWSELGNASA